jgi:hypothetical protein
MQVDSHERTRRGLRMRVFSKFSMITTAIVVSVVLSSAALADEDNTGTNPVNFTYDARFITEVAEFEDGGGSLLTNTFEFRWPLGRNVANLTGKGKGSLFYDMGNRLSMRVRARYQHLSVDTPGASPFDTSEVSGIGDFDARVLGIAYTGKKLIVATGLEAFFDTASNDALGAGKRVVAVSSRRATSTCSTSPGTTPSPTSAEARSTSTWYGCLPRARTG